GVCLRQRVRGDLGVMLGGGGTAVSEPCLQLEQRHRLFGVVELAGDGGAGAVAGDLAADVGGGDTGFSAQRRDDRVVDVDLGDGLGAHAKQHVDVFAGL